MSSKCSVRRRPSGVHLAGRAPTRDVVLAVLRMAIQLHSFDSHLRGSDAGSCYPLRAGGGLALLWILTAPHAVRRFPVR